MKTLDELQALVNGYKRGSVRFDYLSDVLRELIADAKRWRYWRNLWPALTKMDVARFARLDLTQTYVDSPEKMDEVTDAARKG